MQTPEELLRGWGLSDRPWEFDSSIHSWRCEHPDRYGECSCFQELVQELAARDEAIRADERAKVLAELEGADCAHDWGSPFEMPEIGWSKVRECADCGAVERIEREAGVLNADA